MLAKENSVTLITITKLFNVQKYLVSPSNNFPISYKQSYLQCMWKN